MTHARRYLTPIVLLLWSLTRALFEVPSIVWLPIIALAVIYQAVEHAGRYLRKGDDEHVRPSAW